MERTKKVDAEKKTGKATKGPTQEPETVEQGKDTVQERELLELEQSAAKETVEANQPNVQESDVFAKLPDPFAYCLARLPNPCVYCGPSVKGVARQYTTYHGGIPDALREFIKEHPQALGLIVSVEGFQAMRKRLETRGTLEEKLYKAVKAEL